MKTVVKTAAVISEFNPFHGGHAYLFAEIRRALGEDTAIIAILSGNFVQRGEAACIRKQARAEAALAGGCDLVLELPFPYSSATAERFARAGVAIADALGCVDVLAFGAECGDTATLSALAARLEANEFRDAYFSAAASLGSAEKTEAVYRSLYGEDKYFELLSNPNDLLGVEYIRALLRAGSAITPWAIKRMGAGHDEVLPASPDRFPSGKSIREALYAGDEGALLRLPSYSAEVIKSEISERKSLADNKMLMNYLLMHYRLCPTEQAALSDGMTGGLYERVLHAAQEAADGDDFFARLRTKKYTDAFLRRALLAGVFGLTREMLNGTPAYSQILGMNDRGQKILRDIRKTAAVPLLTKPGDYTALPPEARAAAELSLRADSLYAALFRAPISPADTLRYFPVRKISRK